MKVNKVKKSPSNIALKNSDQKKFKKSVSKFKKDLKALDNTLAADESINKADFGKERGTVYLGHLPPGFEESQMRAYFQQFGPLTKVRLMRSTKTGRSKGYAFIEFRHAEVAKVVAETMHNYLMFKRRLEAKYIPADKTPKKLFKPTGATTKTKFHKKEAQRKARILKNSAISDEKHRRRVLQKIEKLKAKNMLDCVQIEFLDFPIEGVNA